MAVFLLPILLSSFFLSFPFPSFSRTFSSLTTGSSLSTQDVLVSTPDAVFTAGFFRVGENSYCFSIWFTELHDGNHTIVWIANRDQPVNGRHTKLSLQNSGNLELIDAGQLVVWTSSTGSRSTSARLELGDNGNLVLSTPDGQNLWQSFDSPTNTLLPEQLLTRNSFLVSSRSKSNHSSGFYKLYFGSDNVLHLRYEGPEITNVFWPDPSLIIWDAGRSTFNSSKVAMLDSSGYFISSDELTFNTSDYGFRLQRRLVMDVDGNLRVYSLDKASRTWKVTWQQSSEPCNIPGICGANSICSSAPDSERKCACIPGYKMKNVTDWSYGCEPNFKLSCNGTFSSGFIQLLNVQYPGYDLGSFSNYTLERCKSLCLSYCECKGFQYKFDLANGYYRCNPKSILFNGYRSGDFQDPMYIRVPTVNLGAVKPGQDFNLQCTSQITQLDRHYERKKQDWVKSFLWCTSAVGAFEIICLLTYFFKTRRRSSSRIQGYLQVATGFRKFSYSELKKATRNFSEEIGRGGGGVVYKGVLPDNRVAAVKYLKEAIQGEAEFLAEISTIGRLNHMNLIEIWGYCAEGKHRLLVYEYMEHGTLSENLYSDKLDWKKRYEIALGTARGLAYLHEECLEWVLHCDVKPQNILLNSDYQPKVADFGLSKLLNRSGIDNLKFSKIRGTRGYMAPEWAFNLPITSKVDVYSYGIVVLELVTGRRPTGGNSNDDSNTVEPRRLVSWVKGKMQEADGIGSPTPIMEIVDPAMNGDFDMERMESLVKVALKCAEEDIDSRPTMTQVVDILLHQESVPEK